MGKPKPHKNKGKGKDTRGGDRSATTGVNKKKSKPKKLLQHIAELKAKREEKNKPKKEKILKKELKKLDFRRTGLRTFEQGYKDDEENDMNHDELKDGLGNMSFLRNLDSKAMIPMNLTKLHQKKERKDQKLNSENNGKASESKKEKEKENEDDDNEDVGESNDQVNDSDDSENEERGTKRKLEEDELNSDSSDWPSDFDLDIETESEIGDSESEDEGGINNKNNKNSNNNNKNNNDKNSEQTNDDNNDNEKLESENEDEETKHYFKKVNQLYENNAQQNNNNSQGKSEPQKKPKATRLPILDLKGNVIPSTTPESELRGENFDVDSEKVDKRTKLAERKMRRLDQKREYQKKKQEDREAKREQIREQRDEKMLEELEKTNPELIKAAKQYSKQQKLVKYKEEIAILCNEILSDPTGEKTIKNLGLLNSFCLHKNFIARKLAILSTLAIYKDILPGYRIRPLVEMEKKNLMKKETRLLMKFEKELLSQYQKYLSILEFTAKKVLSILKGKPDELQTTGEDKVSVKNTLKLENEVNRIEKLSNSNLESILVILARCFSELLVSHPHFNFRSTLCGLVVKLSASRISQVSDICIQHMEDLFENDLSAGLATKEVIQYMAQMLKIRNFNLKPEILRTVLCIKFSADVGNINPFQVKKKATKEEKKRMSKKAKKEYKEEKELQKEMEEINAEVAKETLERTHTDILKSIFLTYFRILKKAPTSPSLIAVLEGLAKFTHLISVDFMGDLLNALKNLMEEGSQELYNTLQACVAAFRTVKLHGGALNVDLKDFYHHLYSVLPQLVVGISFKKTRDCYPLLLHALTLMFLEQRQPPDRIAAFVKRITTISLYTPPNTTIALLAICRQILIKYPKITQLLESLSDRPVGGGGFLPEVDDPDHSRAFDTTLFDVNLLALHTHPIVSFMGNGIKKIVDDKFILPPTQPLQLYKSHDTSEGGFNPTIRAPKVHPLSARARKHIEGEEGAKPVFIRVNNTFPPSQFFRNEILKKFEEEKSKPSNNQDVFTEFYDEMLEFLESEQLHHELITTKRQIALFRKFMLSKR